MSKSWWILGLLPLPSTSILEVDQLVDAATTLKVEESITSPILTKKAWDEEQKSLWDEGSPIRTHVARGDTSKEVTPFMWMLYVFSFWLAQTTYKEATNVSKIYPWFRISLKGIRWIWLLSFPRTCSKLLLSSHFSMLNGEMSWPRVIPPRKGIHGNEMLSIWSWGALLFRRRLFH